MQMMGGKFRQSKMIVSKIREREGTGFKYCEPFAGAMWSVTRVIDELEPQEVLLADINKPLILLWKALLNDELTLPVCCTEEDWQAYKKRRDENDPLTAWYGIACSFAGRWFMGFARHKRGDTVFYPTSIRSTMRKVDTLKRVNNLRILCSDYWEVVKDLKGWIIYLDPPYDKSAKVHNFKGGFDYNLFYERVKALSQFNSVYVTCFECPEGFTVLYDWGNTTTTLSSFKGKPNYEHKKKVSEKLVVWGDEK